MLGLRLRGGGFKPHLCHCVVSVRKTLSTGSIQEDPSQHNWKIVDWDVKNQIKQTGYNLKNVFLSLKIDFFLAISKIQMKCGILPHLIWVFTVCQGTCLRVSDLQRVHICCGLKSSPWPLLCTRHEHQPRAATNNPFRPLNFSIKFDSINNLEKRILQK